MCRPGRQDACAADLTTTIVEASGKLKQEKFAADPKVPIDCFYVYPTVSNDLTPNSDMIAGPEENRVVQHQLARFGSKCRIYAPLYRQVTLTALRAGLSGKPMAVDRALGYNDVVTNGQVQANWGFHLIDANVAMGNLVEIVGQQAKAYLVQRKKK